MKTLNNIDWFALETHLRNQNNLQKDTLDKFSFLASNLKKLYQAPSLNEPYERNIIYSSKTFEVMLASWAAEVDCAPHDHGVSLGWVWFFWGVFEETHYQFKGELKKSRVHKISENAIIPVKRDEIHSCRSLKAGMSLHLYLPPIDRMKVFDVKNRRTLTLNSLAGAWLPVNPDTIIQQESW